MSDAFSRYLHVQTVESGADEVVVEQPDHPALGNHVGVRHASALHAACHAAAEELVANALHGRGRPELIKTEIEYRRVAMGPLRFVARRTDDDGDSNSPVNATVTGFDHAGKEVATFASSWRVSRDG